jgi:hypothetical protein
MEVMERPEPTPADPGLLAELSAIARRFAGGVSAFAPVVVSTRPDRLVVRFGGVVLKVHAPGADPTALAARLAIAADPGLGDVMLAPVPIPGATLAGVAAQVAAQAGGRTGGRSGGRGGQFVSAWPAGAALGPDDVDDVPWEDAAVLLARLHSPSALAAATRSARASTGGAVPRARPRRRLDRALRRLDALDDPWAREVLRAYATLPSWVRRSGVRPGGTATLIHGDWHLGQLLRPPAGSWRIIDVDDVGVGDPAWDLARPAAWYAAGLLAPQAWERLLHGYLAAGGSALGADADADAGGGRAWAALDGPARALAVQYAAIALTERGSGGAAEPGGEPGGEPRDPTAKAFLDCCRRMAAPAARGRGSDR